MLHEDKQCNRCHLYKVSAEADFAALYIYGFVWDVSKTIGYIAMNFGTDIHVPQMMNCSNFCDLLTLNVAPPQGQSLHLSCETSQHLRDCRWRFVVYNQISAKLTAFPSALAALCVHC